ncbi:hypothetical protein GCM10011490_12100 [Pseudoclavibacter endophyticus]|uniref:Multidrug efflux MFS transporter n=1 Tax=Pseudoclavibacter endophyticus TaxID=1778590 RepID=A0A6H9WEP0_9MICO|nr:MFS transporter [Pseudoclavibacter endophyticus]KAB1649372.1 multidrug efflux MFS transporter [Pseudoclavibacter endophyticus]GGA63130.1 hypothetical protein GCM10011490_12100 [Pseudoclavibacter endophyticus]
MTGDSSSAWRGAGWFTPKRASVAVYMLCMFLNLLDTSSINVALVAIGRSFEVPASHTSVINLGYLVTVAVLIPMSGWLGERYGTIRVIQFSLAVFVCGAVVSATAQDLTWLTAGRVVQGIGGGGLAPLAMGLLYRNFPRTERLRIGVLTSIPIAFAPALGPVVGGMFVEFFNWRGIFLLNLPMCLLAMVIAWRFAREPDERQERRIDLAGAAMTIVGFGGLAYALNSLSRGDASAMTLGTLGGSALVIAALVALELRLGERAFLDVSLLRSPVYARCVLILALSFLAFQGFSFALPLLLQTQLGLAALAAGIVTTCQAAGPVIGGRIGQRLLMRVGANAMFCGSQLAMVVCLAGVVAGFAGGMVWLVAVATAVYGAGGFVSTLTSQTVGFSSIPQRNLGDASSLLQSTRQLSGVAGIAAAAGMMAAVGASSQTAAGAASPGNATSTALAVFGALAAAHLAAAIFARFTRLLPVPGRDD